MQAPKKVIKLTHRQLLVIIVALFAAVLYGQYSVINNLHSKLEEKQRQVSGLQSFNQTLQHKMLQMKQTSSESEFYRQTAMNSNS